MKQVRTRGGDEEKVPVPEKYTRSPRLVVWYRNGYNGAARGFVSSTNWIRRMAEDAAASEAFNDGRRDGEASKDPSTEPCGA